MPWLSIDYGAVLVGEREVTDRLLGWLRGHGDCRLDDGLTEGELRHAERVLRLTVPPRWRAVLMRAHPVELPTSSVRYPDWREPEGVLTRELVDAPVEGLLFDVAENGFWWHAWGPPPREPEQRVAAARARLAEVPRLTPLAGHLFVAGTDDSPVFSIVQADLWVPALSLAELPGGRSQEGLAEDRYPIGAVPFWSELHAYSQFGREATDSRFHRLAQGGL